MNAVTVDTISFRGAGMVTVAQLRQGQRFTLDSILLADFCRIGPRQRILDPGAGTGIISLLLAKKFSSTAITAVEIQEASAELCRWNAQVNGLRSRVSVLKKDIAKIGKSLLPASFDAVVANPPYGKAGRGRLSRSPARRMARHDSADISVWVDLGVFLKNKGKFFAVFAASRASELLALFREKRMEPKRIRFVHASAEKPASLVLVEAVKSAGMGVEVLPPLIVHDPDGAYSSEIREMYGM